MRVCVTSRSMSENTAAIEYANTKFSDIVLNNTGRLWTHDEIAENGYNSEAFIVGLDNINAELLDKLPHLKCISKYGVGTDNIDIQALKERNVDLLTAPGTNKQSVTELVLYKLLDFARFGQPNKSFRSYFLNNGNWRPCLGREISEIKIGILGLGSVGYNLAQLLTFMGCDLHGYDVDETKYAELPIQRCNSALDLWRTCEIVTVHIPGTQANSSCLDEFLEAHHGCRKLLINTSRSSLIDQKKLIRHLALNSQFFYYSDVWNPEPVSESEINILKPLANFDLSPHIGGSTTNATRNMAFTAIDNLAEWCS